MIPSIPIFSVISTAFVLHGVTIAALGPTNEDFNTSNSIFGWFAKSHDNLVTVSLLSGFGAWTANTFLVAFPKK